MGFVRAASVVAAVDVAVAVEAAAAVSYAATVDLVGFVEKAAGMCRWAPGHVVAVVVPWVVVDVGLRVLE